jgi:hypothetical protein
MSATSCADVTKRSSNILKPNYIKLKSEFAPLYVDVDASSFTVEKPATVVAPVEKEARRSITSLAPQGQQELIKSLNISAKPDELLKRLGNAFPITETPPETPPVNRKRVIGNTITKQIVIAVGKTIDGEGLADRIAEIQYGIQLSDTVPVIFNTWNSFESKYGIIDLGKVSSSQGLELKATINAKAGATANLSGSNVSDLSKTDGSSTQTAASPSNSPSATSSTTTGNTSKNTGTTGNTTTSSFEVGPSADATYNTKYESSKQLTSRLLTFNGVLHEKTMIFTQKGEQSYDVEGNSSVVVECKTSAEWAKPIIVTKFKKLYTGKDQQPVPLTDLKPEKIFVLFPDIQADAVGTVQYKFTYRQVKGGSQNVSEARQRVAYVYGEVGYELPTDAPATKKPTETQANPSSANDAEAKIASRTITLLKKKDFRPTTYQIMADSVSLTLNDELLNFDTPAEALDFLEYLYTYFSLNPASNNYLKLGDSALDKVKISSLLIKTIDN